MMNKIYQRITDPVHGDCMQAAIASLFDDTYENVPPFIELGKNMSKAFDQYIDSKGYYLQKQLHNDKFQMLMNPTDECIEKPRFNKKYVLDKLNLNAGVNGYFYCIVLSPKYFSWQSMGTHAVLCDKDLNIVHDPNVAYKNILAYPLSSLIGCNGIIGLYCFAKK